MALQHCIDSASQNFVTVRQILSDEPATADRAIIHHFGGAPFPQQQLHDMAEEYS